MHIDTNILIYLFSGDPETVQFVKEQIASRTQLTISSIAWFEYCNGSDYNTISLTESLLTPKIQPFTAEDSILASKLFQNTGKNRKHLFDCMIAANAINNKEPLATSNAKDFLKFTKFGLKLEAISPKN